MFRFFRVPSCVILLIWGIALVFSSSVNADVASYEESEQVCRNWLTYVTSRSGNWAGDADPRIIAVEEFSANDTVLARYFEISSGGYVLVPVLRDLPPVKAYSETSTFDVDAEGGLALMLREILQHRIRLFVETYGSMEAAQPKAGQRLFGIKHQQQWNLLARPADEFAQTLDKSLLAKADGVGPLLTTGWHQNYPYNSDCPMGDGDRCVVGCVATAMAQIMWYHQWPPAGEGSHTYYWGGDNSCGGSTAGQYLTADFSDPYIYQSTNENLAEINYEVGVAFEMDYGACGSGAYFTPALSALPGNFRYHNSIGIRNRNNYSAQTWFDLIVDQINQGFPLLYGITSHAIVCDGWRTDLGFNQYHINYGWGGTYTAWYAVDDIQCDWGCYLSHEQIVMNIIPTSGKPWLGESTLSDDLYGDGDGIPEAGETIEVYFTIANYGGSEITDVTADLLFDDETIIVIDGSSYLGTIPGRDSVDNGGDPVSFEIPVDYLPRIDSLMLAITWNSGAGGGADTLSVEKAIGGIPVLVIDDDEYNALETYYTETLDSLRLPYDVWIHAAYATPDSAYLSKYDIVIWFTGDYRASPISPAEIDVMRAHMDGGGNLFLTGQGIAAQLHGTDSVFLADYLRSVYSKTSGLPILTPASGSQLFTVGDTIVISGYGGASNQDYPDLIQPINGSVAEMKYVNETDFGAVTYSGDYRLVFFSFGFEGIIAGNDRWIGRVETLSRILDYFQCQTPNTCPTASDPSVSPGDPTHLTDHTPLISWTYSDAEGSLQTTYQVQVSADYDWDIAEMWDSGPSAGDDTQVAYTGLDLEDGQVYYIRVRVHDGNLWSGWAGFNIRMNSVPTVPAGLTPDNLLGVASATPQLTHENASDAQNDTRKYAYEIYADAAQTVLVTSASDQSEGYLTTSWTVDVALDDEEDYYWRVRASDAYEDGEWSPLAAFGVNTTNFPPDAFDLLSPEDEAALTYLQPTFEWTSSSDPDLYDAVAYALYYSTDSSFASGMVVSDLDTNRYFVPEQLDYGNVYYWKVRAYDRFDGETFSSRTFTFSTATIGDADGDGNINVADAVFLINYIFKGGPAPDPLFVGDANCDNDVNLADAVYIVNFVFNNGPEPGCI